MAAENVPLITPDQIKPVEVPRQDWSSNRADIGRLEAELRKTVEGEVRFDAGSKAMYAVDASNYRQVPIGVVVPKIEGRRRADRGGLPQVRRAGAVARRRHQPGRPVLQRCHRHRLVEVHAPRS